MVEVKEKKKLHIKVPTKVVRNDNGIFLSNADFLLYARLCFLYFRNYQKEEILIDHRKLMNFLKINDTRTLKKQLNNLRANKLIKSEHDKLPTKGNLKVIFNSEIYGTDDYFTMLSAEIFTYYNNEQINEYAFRQIFYYKSHINITDKERDRSFCFVGFELLVSRLKVSKTKIVEANQQLKKAKLIEIKKHKLEHDYIYNEEDELVFDRYNNHYYVANSLF